MFRLEIQFCIAARSKLSANFIMKITILFITFAFILFSCKKDENPTETYHVWGQVIDHYFNKPVPNAIIRVYTGQNTYSTNYERFRDIAYEGRTDDSGRFDFTYQTKKRNWKGVAAFKEGYFDSKGVYLISNGKIDKYLQPLKNINFHIKNIDPVDDADSIYIDMFLGVKKGFKGKNIDTTILISFQMDLSQRVEWVITQNGDSRHTLAYIDCIPLDTCTYKIHF